MLKRIKKWFNGSNDMELPKTEIIIPPETLEEIDSMRDGMESMMTRGDVLRYPPAEIGFPALIPGEYILREKQEDMILAIKREINIRDSEFEQLMMPMLINFANFVQLFPASEHHHHRAQSGLMRHSLEVCFQSIRKAKNIEFDSMEVPVVKSNRMLAWRLAIATGGLLHDIGKPFTDFEVWDRSGVHHWPPGRTPLHEWAKEKDIERYFLVWKSGRYQQHHASTNAMMMMIMPKILHDFLLSEGNDIYNELTRAMAVSANRLDNADANAPEMKNKILKIIKEADSVSVRHDMQRYGGDAIRATQSGVPAVQRVVDAMRYLLKKGIWKPNKPGSPVWVTTHGVYIVWGTAVKDITDTVKKSGAVIPQSANSLADLMMSYKLCVPNVNKHEDTAYWRIAPHIMNDRDSRNSNEPKVALSCLRLVSTEVLFVDTLEPLPISTRIRIEGEWREFLSSKNKNVPILKESHPYVGDIRPRENSIPADVNPSILKGGTLIPDEDDTPLSNLFGVNNPVTEENAHKLLHHLNLLSNDDYERLNAHKIQKNKQADASVNQKPGEPFVKKSLDAEPAGKPVEIHKQPNESQPELAFTASQTASNDQNNPSKFSLKELLSHGHDSLPTRQSELPLDGNDEALSFGQATFDYQDPGYDRATLSLWETLAHHEVVESYQQDEKNLSEQAFEIADPMLAAKQFIQKHQDEVDRGNLESPQQQDEVTDSSDNNFGYSEYAAQNQKDVSESASLHSLQSPLFANADDQAKDTLAMYVKSHIDSLYHETGHCCVILDNGRNDTLIDAMQKADWVWHPFMEAPSDYYTHRSQMCFYLRKELNEDIVQLSSGHYRKILSPVDLSLVEVNMTDLYRAIALKGTPKKAYNGDPVIALSSVSKRRIATDLGVNANQLQQLLIDNFDYSTRTGVDYILADERIQNYMVNKDE